LGTTPNQTVHFDGLDGSGQLLHAGLVIPGLDFESNGGLSDGLGLVGLLGGVLSKTLSLELLGSIIDLLVVRTEKIDIIIIFLGSSSRSSIRPVKRAWLGFNTNTRLKNNQDMDLLVDGGVPLGNVSELTSGSSTKGLGDSSISVRGSSTR
jgi:hypothetical protein